MAINIEHCLTEELMKYLFGTSGHKVRYMLLRTAGFMRNKESRILKNYWF